MSVRKEAKMSETRYSLCPNCDACPEVVVADEAVLIGEAGNQVRLSPEEWNVLVKGVKSGAIGRVGSDPDDNAPCGCGCDC
jgi:hypothetical protein